MLDQIRRKREKAPPPTTPRRRALVTDAGLRSTVAGIRGLGRAGIEVVAGAQSHWAAGRMSRYVTAGVPTPEPTDHEAFVAAVRSASNRHGPLVVFPGRESAVDALAGRQDAVAIGSVLAMADSLALERLRSKSALSELAKTVGLGAPQTLAIASASELARAALPVPCVVKPQRPSQVLPTARLIDDRDQLAALLNSLPEDEPLLVQERAQGRLAAVALVMDRSGTATERFQQIALRTSTRESGVSALAVGVAPDEELLERVGELLRAAGFWGLAQVQFIEAAGGPMVIDVNPRFYGSLPLALASGANLPAAWHDAALDTGHHRPSTYRPGVRFRWLEAELAAARREGRGRLRPARRPATGAIWAPDDPVPTVSLTAQALTVRLRRRLERT